jgi:hypothetical protein
MYMKCLSKQFQITGILILLLDTIQPLNANCEIGSVCSGCKRFTDPDATCYNNGRKDHFIFCDEDLR